MERVGLKAVRINEQGIDFFSVLKSPASVVPPTIMLSRKNTIEPRDYHVGSFLLYLASRYGRSWKNRRAREAKETKE